MIDPHRLTAAYEQARDDLLSQRVAGHWVGELSTSALSTATAVSALALVQRGSHANGTPLEALIERGLSWLASHQNADGGWGDTDKSYSNVATTLLVRAALHLGGWSERAQVPLERAELYLHQRGGIAALRRRYGKDKTFAVPILTNAALAGLVDWSEVAPLPFELACLPQSLYRFLRLPVVSYAVPALVAIGQARYCHRPPWDPLRRLIRGATVEKSLQVLQRMQPASGGYLEAVPLTSFVLMSLAGTGRADHPVSRQAVAFLEQSVRPDGSWPIDTNLATWNTTLAINALSAHEDWPSPKCVDWLLDCQHRTRHPFTGADAGGWGWSDLSGAVPDADDTSGALVALSWLARHPGLDAGLQQRLQGAARAGLEWLLGLQNSDGGWPTFCRGWGKLPFDRSGADLTAHTLRALAAWRHMPLPRFRRAVERGFRYLERAQRADGCWAPLWFGNQDDPHEENPVYGTARVLLGYRAWDRDRDAAARRGARWLASAQNGDGGWGSPNASSVEETAVALEALIARNRSQDSCARQMTSASFFPEVSPDRFFRGVEWLVRAVEDGRHREPSPIGFYFAKLWYYEQLYPLVFTVAALGLAVRHTSPQMAGSR